MSSGGRAGPDGGAGPNSGGGLVGGGGGRFSGGAGGDFVGGAGGDFAGGAPSGGQGQSGGGPNCPSRSWQNGAICEPWTRCQPGEYVEYYGTDQRDTSCLPCPPQSYSNRESAPSCLYAGCDFSEIVVTPGSSTAPAECAPNPHYFPLDATDAAGLIGLAPWGTRVYAALANPTDAWFHAFEAGAALEPLRYSIQGQQDPRAFAIAPDGTFYLSGPDPLFPQKIWLDAIANDTSSATRIPLHEAWSYGEFGLLSTSRGWIHWITQYTESGYELILRTAPHSQAMVGETRVPISSFAHISASSPDRLFIVSSTSTQVVSRMLDFTPPLEEVQLPTSFLPIFTSATATGEAYAVGLRWADERTVEAYKIEADGSVSEHFEHRFEEAIPHPLAVAVDPGRALYVLCFADPDSGEREFVRDSLFLLRFDLGTGTATVLDLEASPYDWAGFLTVTTDGGVYIAGGTALGHYYVKKIY